MFLAHLSSVPGPAGGPSSGRESRFGPNPAFVRPMVRLPDQEAEESVDSARFRAMFARWSGWRTGGWYEAAQEATPSIDAERWAT